MFEITKIINSSASSVEPEIYPVTDGTKIVCGCALVMNEGKLRACETAEVPEYIAASDKADAFGEITVYPVSDTVEFRVRVKGGTSDDYQRGSRVSVLAENGVAASVKLDAKGAGIITGTSEKAGCVHIKFKV